MKVQQLSGPPFVKQQCQCPRGDLHETGWAGYREQRARFNASSPDTCFRNARWSIDGTLLCTQHAGLIVLNHYKEPST